ncbi:MAG: hypothetical protein HPY44_20225 [Armatimonadetes bacterium]|nr:hypothetical protein [Armatimonadota bacterium]
MLHPCRPWFLALALGLVVSQAHAATIRVPSRSINTIQEGIDAASDGDRVLVATGTYNESINFKGKTITVQSTDPEDPEVVAKTVISGAGVTSVVTFNGAEGSDAVLEGFTITGGEGTPIFYPGGIGARAGGGIYCGPLASPTIRHNHIHHNQANTLGAGVFCAGDVTLEENRITDNHGASLGGGVYWSGIGGSIVGNRIELNSSLGQGGGLYVTGSPIVRDNEVMGNAAQLGGGVFCTNGAAWIGENTIDSNSATDGAGIHCQGGDPVISQNLINLNTATGNGGGVWTDQESVISDNRITANMAVNGGGMYIANPALVRAEDTILVGNTISGNATSADGAGIFCNAGILGLGVKIRNSLIIVNRAGGRGGGILCNGTSPDIINCTFSGNGAVAGGGAIVCRVTAGPNIALPHITNSIVAFSSIGGGIVADPSAAAYLSHCDVYGNSGGDYSGLVFRGVDTIGQDPLFADPSHGDYHLKSRGGRWTQGGWVYDSVHSPCIDSGDPSASYADEPLPNGNRVNMGAYGNTIQASMTLLPDPTITGITPSSGINVAPVAITSLKGTDFMPGAGVSLGKSGQPGIPGTDVVVVSPQEITCTFDLTGVLIGPWDVMVSNPNDTTGTLPGGFRVTFPPPQVTGIAPSHGLTTDADYDVEVVGQGFQADATVVLRLAGQPDIVAMDARVAEPTRILCKIDLRGSALGLWDVVVTNRDDLSATLAAAFEIRAPVPGDVNRDHVVDAGDLAAFIRAWRLHYSADPNWDRAADQDQDGDLDATDADMLLMFLALAGAL